MWHTNTKIKIVVKLVYYTDLYGHTSEGHLILTELNEYGGNRAYPRTQRRPLTIPIRQHKKGRKGRYDS